MLLSSYIYCDVWFAVGLLRCGAFHCLVATFHSCGFDLDRQNRFAQSNISYYGH